MKISALDETGNHMNDGRESGYFSQEETDKVMVLIDRTIAALLKWMHYLESPAARRVSRCVSVSRSTMTS